MPALTVSATGDTWTATVIGSGGGSVTLFAATPERFPEPTDWRPVGTRTGDGVLTGSLPPAGYWFYAATAGGPTPPAFALLSPAPGESLPTRCRAAVRATVEALALPAKGVHEEPYPDTANRDFPYISVSAEGVREVIRPGLNNTDDTGFGVKVAVLDRHHARDLDSLKALYEPWRHRIDRAFRHRRLAGVTESIQCTVEPFPVLDAKLPTYQLMISGLVVRCWTRENR